MTIAEQLAKYSKSFDFNDLPQETIHEVKRHYLDSLGCFFGSFSDPMMNKLYKYYAENQDLPNISLFWGAGIRYLDYNDTYLSKEPAHPSDNIAPLLILANKNNIPGKELIAAIALAYEIQCRLCDAASLRNRGWDHTSYIPISAACAVSKLLNLDEKKTRSAIAIAATHCASLRQTRAGNLSEWKGISASYMAQHGMTAALLAKFGICGPYDVFEGKYGFINQLLKNDFSEEFYQFLKEQPTPRKIEETYLKFHPVEYHIQAVADIILEMIRRNNKIRQTEDISSIEVVTYEAAVSIVGKDKEKWDPQTRETADHSIPYIIAVTLADGELWLNQFSQNRIIDEKLRPVMRKINVVENYEMTKLYGQSFPAEIKIEMNNGETIQSRVDFPKGHPGNPMSDNEIEKKFHKLFARINKKEWDIKPEKKIIQDAWNLEKLTEFKF